MAINSSFLMKQIKFPFMVDIRTSEITMEQLLGSMIILMATFLLLGRYIANIFHVNKPELTF